MGRFNFEDDNQAARFTPGTGFSQNDIITITITTDLQDEFENNLLEEFIKDFVYTGADTNIYDRSAPEVEEIRKIGTDFYITFNEEMSGSTASEAVELTSAQGTFIGQCMLDPEDAKTIKFAPSDTLTSGVSYTILVKTNTITDISGKCLSAEFSKSFSNSVNDQFIYEKPDAREHEQSKINNNYLFQGSIYHPEIGLYYFRGRHYHPVLGRFLQPDPMGYQDSFNLYQALHIPVFSDHRFRFCPTTESDSVVH